MTTLMWGERGLVATFFAELGDDAIPRWQQFLLEIGFPYANEISDVWCVVEPDFGTRGFGKPDVVARISIGNGLPDFVLLMEAKRDSYRSSTYPADQRDRAGFNSGANGQIELNHRLAMALSRFQDGDDCLTEEGWIRDSVYVQQNGQLQRLSDFVVLDQVVSRIAGLSIEQYIHVLIDTSPVHPFDDSVDDKDRQPAIYNGPINCWDEFVATRFYWVTWDVLHKLAEKHSWSRFLATYELNKSKLGCSAVSREKLPFELHGLSRGTAIIHLRD